MFDGVRDHPWSVEDLDRLAEYYDTHDTSAEMEHGRWVDPRPMRTTSPRLPDGRVPRGYEPRGWD